MNWKMKALLQGALSSLPHGHRLNYVLQRATRGLPQSDESLHEMVVLGRHHVDALRAHSPIPIADATFFEFGAGWDLGMPLILYCLGVGQQIVVDIRRLIAADLVRDVARRLARRPTPGFVRHPEAEAPLEDLLGDHGIDYRAPCDARRTGMPPGTVDFITSTNTLEHIPADDIHGILLECRRLLSPEGAMSFQIDYQDHYSYADASISAYNFLRYDERRWRWFNPALHHQNRLRHADYLTLFEGAGLEVIAEDLTPGSREDVDTIRALPPAPRFAGRPVDELAVRGSRVVLRPRDRVNA